MSADNPVIVIGGGPAGACVSTLLARMGFPVVLLERERFPRAHVGESLLPGSIPILESLGVMDEVRKARFTVKPGATMIWGTEREPWSWRFSETHASNPHAYQVWRPEFDAILLNNARRSGVDVREGWQVARVLFDNDGGAAAVRCRPMDNASSHGASAGASSMDRAADRATARELSPDDLSPTDGVKAGALLAEVELQARFVVDASGQSGVLSRQLGLREWDDFFRNLAVYGYYKGGARLPSPDAGNILIESQADGWLWHIPLRDGWASVGAVVDAEVGQRGIREQGTVRFLQSQIAAAPYLANMLESAELATEPEVVRDWSYRCRSLHGRGYILVGDAGCFIDPLFSSGVHLALTYAALAAVVVASALEDPTIASPAAQMYEQMYYREYGHFRELARLFYSSNRTADSYFWEARRLLDDDPALTPRQSFIQLVAGQPSRGYERVALSKGLLPPAFGNSVAAVESERRRRRAQGLPPNAPLQLAAGARLQRQPVLEDDRFVWGVGLVTDAHSEGIPCSALVSQLLSRLDGQSTASEAIASLCAAIPPEMATQAEQAAMQALELLYVDGAITPSLGNTEG
ncbi:MAG: NAD(P)/FAD-dependent oxidoreductase [Chloroflexi bacterium]|nr:NAD(P)/FAD-dependent oxidoreductase [Chloroflexota bacterium]